jgi:hypothetical protein
MARMNVVNAMWVSVLVMASGNSPLKCEQSDAGEVKEMMMAP